jgi:sporulation inhibitor KapD
MKEKRQTIFIDFEFTMPERNVRMKNFFAEIIEVGLVAVVDDQITEQFSSYVTPLKFPILTDAVNHSYIFHSSRLTREFHFMNSSGN